MAWTSEMQARVDAEQALGNQARHMRSEFEDLVHSVSLLTQNQEKIVKHISRLEKRVARLELGRKRK